METPARWERVPTKRLFRVIDTRIGDAELPLLAVSIHHGVVPRQSLTDDKPRAEDLRAYKRCAPGDVVLNRMRAFQGAVGVAPEAGAVSPDYLVLRLVEDVDIKFFHHLFRSSWFVGEMSARLRGIGSSDQGNVRTPRINVEDFGEIQVGMPSLDRQQEIARFLDTETARIDALVTRKLCMLRLMNERSASTLDRVVWGAPTREIPLMHLVQHDRPILYGIVLPGPDVGESGVPIVKGGDVAGPLSLKRLARTSHEIELPYARARLRSGDVLFAIRGGVGDAAVVPLALEGSNITQDVARVAPRAGVASEWLLYVLRSPTFQARARELVRGAAITGLNIRDLERIRVPWSDAKRQETDVTTIRPAVQAAEKIKSRLETQIDLLRERRQALITEAVTGQLDVGRAAI
jgi:type I restriction enzyme S subunit